MRVQNIMPVEKPEEIFARVFSDLRPTTAIPPVSAEFCKFANANSSIRLQQGALRIRMTDVLHDAPSSVIEALAYILLSKLYRSPVPRLYNQRYRVYLNRKDVRQRLEHMRKSRGHKLTTAAQGRVYDLEEIFSDVNIRYFHGLMAKPDLGWSLRISRTTLGHYDPSHHAIVISRILDRVDVPKLAVEYVMFHEMLHLRHPVEHRGARRCVHTLEFKEAEKQFEDLAGARELLKKL